MDRNNWGVLLGAVALFTIGLIGGCAPTSPHEEVAQREEALNICGNNVCDTGETCAGCPGDCGRCTGEHCGNDVCGRKETCATCERDCGSCPGCGDGVCEAGETCANCQPDCGRCNGEFCGNGVCTRRESCTACSRDCCPAPPEPECLAVTDCPDPANECITRTCVAGQCGTTFVSAGTLLTEQLPDDCLQGVCDGAGNAVFEADDSEIPADDGNECTFEQCSEGTPLSQPQPAGTSCMGLNVCDGAGNCVGCVFDGDCPPAIGECQQPACISNSCGVTFLPAGEPTTNQSSGDCQYEACDGAGGTALFVDDTDLPLDGQACTYDLCTFGVPSNPSVPDGTMCTTGPTSGGTCLSGVCLEL